MASDVAQSSPESLVADGQRLKSGCRGVPPIEARWADWMLQLCGGDELHRLVEQYGSPLNVHHTAPFRQNIDRLYRTAQEAEIRFAVYFARKANKCIAYIETAREIGCGVDVASLEELRQTLSAGIPPERIVVTAAVKSAELLQTCVAERVVTVVDNNDELNSVARQASRNAPAEVAVRVSGFTHQGEKLHSRFGFDVESVESAIGRAPMFSPEGPLRVVGIHFHLDGYSASQRISALREAIALADALRSAGHPLAFIDMGGGMPMSYVRAPEQLEAFWQRLEDALVGKAPPVTWNNHGLGRYAVDGVLHGCRETYPYYQKQIGASWLQSILAADVHGQTIAELLREKEIELRCEPGRSVFDNCGFTAARVEFRKQATDGTHLVGLSMNHTQCRTGSLDFLVDPLLVRKAASVPTDPIEAYLTGAYCTESEFLTWRRLAFPQGVAVGDLIVFPNTAGYLMHFRESRSHQLPLAKNVIVQDLANADFCLDLIDR